MNGTYEEIDGRPALHFERRLDHPVEAVWRAVTEPSELAHWFPSQVEVDLRPGGTMTFTFTDQDLPQMTGEVLEVDEPHRFAFTWGDDELRIELEPEDGGNACLLRFTTLLGERDTAARNAAGWHVCLDRLASHVAGDAVEPPSSAPTDEWQPLYEDYERRGFPSGAPIPNQS